MTLFTNVSKHHQTIESPYPLPSPPPPQYNKQLTQPKHKKLLTMRNNQGSPPNNNLDELEPNTTMLPPPRYKMFTPAGTLTTSVCIEWLNSFYNRSTSAFNTRMDTRCPSHKGIKSLCLKHSRLRHPITSCASWHKATYATCLTRAQKARTHASIRYTKVQGHHIPYKTAVSRTMFTQSLTQTTILSANSFTQSQPSQCPQRYQPFSLS